MDIRSDRRSCYTWRSSIADKRNETTTVAQVQKMVLEEPIESASTNVNEIIINDIKEQISDNKHQEDVKEVAIQEVEASVTEEKVEFGNDKLQIVYLGDRIFDFHRDDGTSIPKLTSEKLDANFINLAMGGTCASI